MWVVERRYALQTLYALERADSDPMRIADDRLPTPAQMDVTGGIGEVLARLGEARAESNRRLGDVAPALMTRPTIWARYDADVRFRLHRFAAHVSSTRSSARRHSPRSAGNRRRGGASPASSRRSSARSKASARTRRRARSSTASPSAWYPQPPRPRNQ
jgi:hypothetical protein